MKNDPGSDDLKRILALRGRAELKAVDSLDDYARNKRLVDGDLQEWENISPIASLTGKNTVVVRNSIGQNVRDDADRIMPTDPVWDVEPVVQFIYRERVDQMTGQPITDEIDNMERALRFRAACNFVSKATKQWEEVYREVLDARTGNNGYIIVTVPEWGADVSHTIGYPATREDGAAGEEVGKKILRGKVLHSAVQPYLPVFFREPPSNVFLDPDACTDKEVNCIFRWVCRPLVDVKKDKRYKNTEGLRPNVQYNGLRYRPKNNKEPEGPNSSTQKYDPDGASDMIGMWEYHYRVPAAPGVPTVNGYVYWCMTIVDQGTDDSATPNSEPVCIRHEPYPVDHGGFAIKRLQFTIQNDDNYGYSAPIRYSKRANATENSLMSMLVAWVMTNKTRRIWNKGLLSTDDVEMIEQGEANDNILLNLKSEQDLSRMVTSLPATDVPPEIGSLIGLVRGVADESYGLSANQRGQYAGARTASEAQIVAEQTKSKTTSLQKRFKLHMEDVQSAGMAIFSALLPETQPNGKKWSIPDPRNRGKFIDFSASDLECAVTLSLDYTSMGNSDDAMTVKQGTDLVTLCANLAQNPQLLMAAEPFLSRIALALGPSWEAQLKRFYDNLKRGAEEVADPDKEHILMLQGEPCQPNPDEDFTRTIPVHEAQMKIVDQLPKQEQVAWLRPIGQGPDGPVTPLALLRMHIEESRAMAAGKGIQVPPSGATGGGGAGPEQPGSGPASGRTSQAAPTAGDLAGGAGNTGAQNMGLGR